VVIRSHHRCITIVEPVRRCLYNDESTTLEQVNPQLCLESQRRRFVNVFRRFDVHILLGWEGIIFVLPPSTSHHIPLSLFLSPHTVYQMNILSSQSSVLAGELEKADAFHWMIQFAPHQVSLSHLLLAAFGCGSSKCQQRNRQSLD